MAIEVGKNILIGNDSACIFVLYRDFIMMSKFIILSGVKNNCSICAVILYIAGSQLYLAEFGSCIGILSCFEAVFLEMSLLRVRIRNLPRRIKCIIFGEEHSCDSCIAVLVNLNEEPGRNIISVIHLCCRVHILIAARLYSHIANGAAAERCEIALHYRTVIVYREMQVTAECNSLRVLIENRCEIGCRPVRRRSVKIASVAGIVYHRVCTYEYILLRILCRQFLEHIIEPFHSFLFVGAAGGSTVCRRFKHEEVISVYDDIANAYIKICIRRVNSCAEILIAEYSLEIIEGLGITAIEGFVVTRDKQCLYACRNNALVNRLELFELCRAAYVREVADEGYRVKLSAVL